MTEIAKEETYKTKFLTNNGFSDVKFIIYPHDEKDEKTTLYFSSFLLIETKITDHFKKILLSQTKEAQKKDGFFEFDIKGSSVHSFAYLLSYILTNELIEVDFSGENNDFASCLYDIAEMYFMDNLKDYVQKNMRSIASTLIGLDEVSDNETHVHMIYMLANFLLYLSKFGNESPNTTGYDNFQNYKDFVILFITVFIRRISNFSRFSEKKIFDHIANKCENLYDIVTTSYVNCFAFGGSDIKNVSLINSTDVYNQDRLLSNMVGLLKFYVMGYYTYLDQLSIPKTIGEFEKVLNIINKSRIKFLTVLKKVSIGNIPLVCGKLIVKRYVQIVREIAKINDGLLGCVNDFINTIKDHDNKLYEDIEQ
jgi:hypothetical protein